jgi:hypothetical protein
MSGCGQTVEKRDVRGPERDALLSVHEARTYQRDDTFDEERLRQRRSRSPGLAVATVAVRG